MHISIMDLPNHKKIFVPHIIHVFLGSFLSLIFIFLFFFALNYLNIVHLSIIFPFLSFLPHAPYTISTSSTSLPHQGGLNSLDHKLPITDFVEQCPVNQTGNSLVRTVIHTKEGSVGALLGNVNSISYDPTTKTASIDLISIDGAQEHVFQLADQNGLVFDVAHNTPATLADIKLGQAVQLSVQCDSYTRNQFTVTQVAIEP